MNYLYYMALYDLLAIIILALIEFNAFKRKKILGHDYRYILHISVSIQLIIIFDFFIFLFNNENLKVKVMMDISSILYFILAPLPPYFWAVYTAYKCNNNKEINLSKKILILSVFIINFVICMLNIPFNIFYKITDNAKYLRGPYIYISMFLPFIYLALSYYLIIKNKMKFSRKNFKYMFIYPIIPALATLFQPFLSDNFTIIWQFTSISVLILYMNMYEEMAMNDELTGLLTRKKFMDEANSTFDKARKGNTDQKNQDKYVGIIFDNV
jgi:hypothetical protein